MRASAPRAIPVTPCAVAVFRPDGMEGAYFFADGVIARWKAGDYLYPSCRRLSELQYYYYQELGLLPEQTDGVSLHELLTVQGPPFRFRDRPIDFAKRVVAAMLDAEAAANGLLRVCAGDAP